MDMPPIGGGGDLRKKADRTLGGLREIKEVRRKEAVGKSAHTLHTVRINSRKTLLE